MTQRRVNPQRITASWLAQRLLYGAALFAITVLMLHPIRHNTVVYPPGTIVRPQPTQSAQPDIHEDEPKR